MHTDFRGLLVRPLNWYFALGNKQAPNSPATPPQLGKNFKIDFDMEGCRILALEKKKVRERTGITSKHSMKLLKEAPLEALQNNSTTG